MARYTVSFNLAQGKVQFRHPHVLVKDDRGRAYGKPLKFGVGKLTAKDQGQIVDDLNKLLQAAPLLRSEAPTGLHEKAYAFYFDPMAEQAERIRQQKRDEALRPELETLIPKQHAGEYRGRGNAAYLDIISGLTTQVTTLTARANEETKKREQAESELEGLTRAVGYQTEEQKKITLQQCLEQFTATVSCKSERARSDLIRKVTGVLEVLGLHTPHCRIRRVDIEAAVTKLVPDRKATEHIYKLRDMKRFFRAVSLDENNGGLGLPDPAYAIKPGTPRATARETLDPLLLLDLNLDDYWKAFVACLGLAGMRLSEAASLEWTMLDFDEKIIRLVESEQYPELKSANSVRDIPPFAQFWDHMEKHKQTATHSVLVFPKIVQRRPSKHGDKDHWFVMRKDKPSAVDLPGAFYAALKVAGVTVNEPARRLRRFFQTEIQARGLGYLLDACAGNTQDVRRAHYLNRLRIVSEAARTGVVGKL